MNEKHLHTVDEKAIKRALANLNNLTYFTSIDGKKVVASVTYTPDTHKYLHQSLKALGLSIDNSITLSNNKDYFIMDVEIDGVGITELVISESGAKKLAIAGVKSEVLQTFLSIEEPKKTTHASTVRGLR